jgi:hypothetical protein
MIDIKYELIGQTKKNHWSQRQVAKFHWVRYILIDTCQSKRSLEVLNGILRKFAQILKSCENTLKIMNIFSLQLSLPCLVYTFFFNPRLHHN